MAAVYGSATINGAASKGNTLGVQDMISTSVALRADSNYMQNGHIGAGQDQIVVPVARAAQIGAEGTPALGHLGDVLYWHLATGTWTTTP